MAKVVKKETKKESDSKLFAFLGVFLTVIGFVITYVAKKNDKYAMFYGKQGLVLFFACVIVWVAGWILGIIPFLGDIIVLLANIGLIILWIFGLVYSLSGEMKYIPVIGHFANRF